MPFSDILKNSCDPENGVKLAIILPVLVYVPKIYLCKIGQNPSFRVCSADKPFGNILRLGLKNGVKVIKI